MIWEHPYFWKHPFVVDKFVNMIEEMSIPLVGINSVGSGGETLKI